MNLTASDLYLPTEGFRWYGPDDIVPLQFIRQSGATSIFTSLHHLPYGEVWSREAIRSHKLVLESAGFSWSVVESLPVHEDIKTGSGNLKRLFANYAESLRNLADEGVQTVMYNFMPLLDWVRTNNRHVLPDGSECLLFDPLHFAAFELQVLGRKAAEALHSSLTLAKADRWWNSLTATERSSFLKTIIGNLPGCKRSTSLSRFQNSLARYKKINQTELQKNLVRFLEAVIPTAERAGVRLAIHPDDPPFPLLGLPRIVSTAEHIDYILKAVDSPSSGLCFCTGSLSARSDNDLADMFNRFGARVLVAHLRSTQRLPNGSFYEADHLAGTVDMPSIVHLLINEQDRRRALSRQDWQIPFRSDHGHTMMDDLAKQDAVIPGYSCIGRMRGLAELRGLMLGIRYMIDRVNSQKSALVKFGPFDDRNQ